MSEERMRILDMVREGKITAEEAVRLLEALKGASAGGGTGGGRRDRADDPVGAAVGAVIEAFQSRGWSPMGGWGGLGGPFAGAWSTGPLDGLERRRQREAEGWEFLTLSEGDRGAFDLPEGARLRVENEAGGIHVEAVDGPARVDLEGEDLHDFAVYVARKDQDVVVAAHRTARHARMPRLRVAVPRHVAGVELRTGGGGLRARGLACPVTLKTSGGGITVEEQRDGPVEARTSGGGIKVEGTPRSISLKTSGGGIRFQGRTDAVEAKTSGGSVHIEGARLTAGEHQVKTSGGSVRVGLAPESSVAIAARTSAGSVRVELPGAQGTHSGSRISPRYSGTYNGEGARLDVSTAAGSISIGLAESAPPAAASPAADSPRAERDQTNSADAAPPAAVPAADSRPTTDEAAC